MTFCRCTLMQRSIAVIYELWVDGIYVIFYTTVLSAVTQKGNQEKEIH